MKEADASSRITLIDVFRGVALVAMMIFHGAWDVSYFRLLHFDPGASPGWTIFARLIAGSFLLLAGISLVLSTRNGFRPRPYWRRLAMVVGAAILVSVATWFILPQGWVFFGILHQIALASVIALPFLRLPALATIAVAALFFIVPHVFRSEIFAAPALWWVGLAPDPPPSFDYVPLFPWFGCVLAGVALGRIGVAYGWDTRLARWRPRFAPGRLLAFGGRNSLVVYLVHQPLLFGLFFVIAHVLLPDTAVNAARTDCVDRCVAVRGAAAGCEAYCGCVFDEMTSSGLIKPLLDASMTLEQSTQLRDMAGSCTAKTWPMPPAPAPTGETPSAEPTGSDP